jgi:hypothetical protein
VSQHAVERTIGKLATDEAFRARFFDNPAAATWEAGLLLSPGELEALSALPRASVTRFGRSLDSRLRRLCVAGAPVSAARRQPRRASNERSDAGTESAT